MWVTPNFVVLFASDLLHFAFLTASDIFGRQGGSCLWTEQVGECQERIKHNSKWLIKGICSNRSLILMCKHSSNAKFSVWWCPLPHTLIQGTGLGILYGVSGERWGISHSKYQRLPHLNEHSTASHTKLRTCPHTVGTCLDAPEAFCSRAEAWMPEFHPDWIYTTPVQRQPLHPPHNHTEITSHSAEMHLSRKRISASCTDQNSINNSLQPTGTISHRTSHPPGTPQLPFSLMQKAALNSFPWSGLLAGLFPLCFWAIPCCQSVCLFCG